jgi:hypothetical protein
MGSYDIRVIDWNRLHLESKKNNKGKIKHQFSKVLLRGFNSAKFDMNLLLKYLQGKNDRIISTLGKSCYNKCLKVETNAYNMDKVDDNGEHFHDKITYKFVDIMIYAPGCTLAQFTQDETDKKEIKREKGFFPYESITTDYITLKKGSCITLLILLFCFIILPLKSISLLIFMHKR